MEKETSDNSTEDVDMAKQGDREWEDENDEENQETSFIEKKGISSDSERKTGSSEVHLSFPGCPTVPLAEDEDYSLTPQQVTSLNRMQTSTADYRHNLGEAHELGALRQTQEPLNAVDGYDGDNTNGSSLRNLKIEPAEKVDTMATDTREAEEGQKSDEIDYKCTCLGPLNNIGTLVAHLFIRRRRGSSGMLTFAIATIVILSIITFLAVFPASFRYIEYHQLALTKSKLTGAVDRSTTYYPGCYILGPNTELVLYEGIAHNVDLSTDIFTSDKLVISINFHLQYFIKEDELGELHKKFETNYDPVFRKIILSTVKNEAGQFSVDQYRLNRTLLEKRFHTVLRRRLGGNCCPSCCKGRCSGDPRCLDCELSESCDRAYHVDIKFFQMSEITIPDDVFERFLRQTLLKVEVERELLIQAHALVVKETDKLVKAILNEAREIRENGTAYGELIMTRAEADYEVTVQTAYAHAMKSMYSRLNITQTDHQLSLMMIRALDDMKDNLYHGYAYDVYKAYSP